MKEATNKTQTSNFILNDLLEIFVYFKFLFDHVSEIMIFSKDLNYLVDIYNQTLSEGKILKEVNRQKVIDEFWKSFKQFVSKEDNKIKVLFKDGDSNELFQKSEKLQEILGNVYSANTIQFWQLNHELSFVEGLAFFMLSPSFQMVYTAQKIGNNTWNACYFKDSELYNNANNIYTGFLKYSTCISIEKSNDNGR